MTAAAGLSRAFWSGRRVFVTGHTGFKVLADGPAATAWRGAAWLCARTSLRAQYLYAADVGLAGGLSIAIQTERRPQAAIAEAAPEIALHPRASAGATGASTVETFSTTSSALRRFSRPHRRRSPFSAWW